MLVALVEDELLELLFFTAVDLFAEPVDFFTVFVRAGVLAFLTTVGLLELAEDVAADLPVLVLRLVITLLVLLLLFTGNVILVLVLLLVTAVLLLLLALVVLVVTFLFAGVTTLVLPWLLPVLRLRS